MFLHPTAAAIQTEGCGAGSPAVWCSVQDSLCQLSKGVHRTNWMMTLSATD